MSELNVISLYESNENALTELNANIQIDQVIYKENGWDEQQLLVGSNPVAANFSGTTV